MVLLLSWFGIIGYALIAYAIFADGQEWAFGGAAFFLIFFLIKYHSLNPFAPWTSKKSKSDTTDKQVHQPQQTQQYQQTQQSLEAHVAPEPEPEDPIVRLCPNCGTPLQEGQVFCENCGTRVD